MAFIAVFDWSLYTTSLSQYWLEVSTHGNDPAQTGTNPYDSGLPTWTGLDFTFNGGASTLIEINDDDGIFEDGYVETGGDQTLAQDVTINGVDYFAGDVVENEFSLLDSGNEVFVVRINGVNVGFGYTNGNAPTLGEIFNADDTRDGDAPDSLDQVTPSDEPYSNILCFAVGTQIMAERGPVPVESLGPGNLVWTVDHGLQPVRWRRYNAYDWPRSPDKQKPILFTAGSLGAGLPVRDLIVSPQHRMLVPDREEAKGVLCPAKAMTGLPGVRQMRGRRHVELVHIMFDRHEIVLAENTPSESFFPGDVAMRGFSAQERNEVRTVVARATGDPNGQIERARAFLKVSVATRRFKADKTCWDVDLLARAGVLQEVFQAASLL